MSQTQEMVQIKNNPNFIHHYLQPLLLCRTMRRGSICKVITLCGSQQRDNYKSEPPFWMTSTMIWQLIPRFIWKTGLWKWNLHFFSSKLHWPMMYCDFLCVHYLTAQGLYLKARFMSEEPVLRVLPLEGYFDREIFIGCYSKIHVI